METPNTYGDELTKRYITVSRQILEHESTINYEELVQIWTKWRRSLLKYSLLNRPSKRISKRSIEESLKIVMKVKDLVKEYLEVVLWSQDMKILRLRI